MAVDVQLFKNLDFFENLTYPELEQFAALLNSKTIKAGDVLIKKGTPALTFYIILSGVFKISYEGRSITLDQEGDVLGWSTVVMPFHYRGTVEAIEEGTMLYISSRDFYRLIQNNNELGEKIVKKIDRIATERRAAAKGLQ